MRRLSKYLNIGVLILVFVLAFFSYDLREKENFYKGVGQSSTFEYVHIPKDYSKEMLDEITKLSKQHDVLLERQVLVYDETVDKNILVHYVGVDGMKDFSMFFRDANIKEDRAITTYKTELENTTVKKVFLNNDFHKYDILDNLTETAEISGTYIFNAETEVIIDDFIDQINSIYGEDNGFTDLEKIDYIEYTISKELLKQLPYMLVIISFILMFTIIFDFMNSSKRVGIYKLLGKSNKELSNTYYLKSVRPLVPIIFIILFGTIIYPGMRMAKFTMELAIIYFFLLLIIYIFIRFISWFIHSKYNLSALLKGEKITDRMMILSMFFRFAITIVLGIYVITSLHSYNLMNSLKNQTEEFKKYGNDLVISTFKLGSGIEEDFMKGKNAGLYKEIGDSNNLVYSNINKNELELPDGELISPIFSLADLNYIKRTGFSELHTISEENIRNNKGVILVPDNSKLVDEEIIFKYREYYADEEQDIKIIRYEAGLKWLTLNPSVGIDSNFTIQEPYIVVFGETNADLYEDDLELIGLEERSNFRISHNGESDWYEENKDLLAKHDLLGHVDSSSFKTINQITSQIFAEYKTQNLRSYQFVSVVLIIYIFLVMNTLMTYVKFDFKRITVKKSLGYSDIKVLRTYLFFNGLMIIFAFLIAYLNIRSLRTETVPFLTKMTGLGICLIIEIVVQRSTIRYFFNKNLPSMLKGGSND